MIFLADIYDPSDEVGDPASASLPDWPDCLAIHRAYNQAIRRAAEKHKSVHMCGCTRSSSATASTARKPWREHYHANDPHYWYACNLEDPNERGYDAIRRLFLVAIAREADRIAAQQPTARPRAAAGAIP